MADSSSKAHAISRLQGRRWRSLVVPAVVGSVGLTLAVAGAFLAREGGGVSGLNRFVETLSGNSSSFVGNTASAIPLGFAFGAGAASAFNPCGFALLPAYLGLFLGADERRSQGTSPAWTLARALLVATAVTAGFVLLFGIAGVVIGGGATALVDIFPWIGLTIGVALALAGTWLLAGNKLYSGLAARAASRIGESNQRGVRGYVLFGLSYGAASLSCTLPIFLAVVGTTFSLGNFLPAFGQFVLYALGMGLVILVLTLAVAVFKGAVTARLRQVFSYVEPFSACLMVVAGSYIVFYWLTVGRLLDKIVP